MLAGRRALYEYQLQLSVDIPSFDDISTRDSFIPLYGFFRFGSTALAMLDLRYQRTFFPETVHAFVGTPQYDSLAYHLQAWTTDDSVRNIIVASSIPVLYPNSFLARVADWFESERYSTHAVHVEDTRLLLALLGDAARRRRVVAVAGDLHVFANQTYCSTDDVCFESIVTSGVTLGSSVLRSPHLYLYTAFSFTLLLPSLPATDDHPGWQVDVSRLELTNSYALFTEEQGILKWTAHVRSPTTFEAIQTSVFRWLVYPFLSTLVWIGILLLWHLASRMADVVQSWRVKSKVR